MLVFELQGVVASLDPKLNNWLQYAPAKRTVCDVDTSVVDPHIAEAALPLKSTKMH